MESFFSLGRKASPVHVDRPTVRPSGRRMEILVQCPLILRRCSNNDETKRELFERRTKTRNAVKGERTGRRRKKEKRRNEKSVLCLLLPLKNFFTLGGGKRDTFFWPYRLIRSRFYDVRFRFWAERLLFHRFQLK